MKAKKVAFLGISVALAMVLSFVESQVTLLIPIYGGYGIKIGLANIVIVFLLYRFSFWETVAVSLVRVLLVSLLFGNLQTLLFSLAGAVLSLLGMLILKKWFSEIAVSVAGGVLHNLGQIAVAVLWTQTPELAFYLPVLLVTGTAAGIVIGIVSVIVLKRFEKSSINKFL